MQLGFGMHVGWAIEGAIGSQFKIDASYLSPNVNMASRLENATKQFGVHLFLSGDVYNILTPHCRYYMRHIDTVVVKGSAEPVRLYTCDVDPDRLKVDRVYEEHDSNMQQRELYKRRVKHRIKRKRFREKAFENQVQVASLFETDKDLKKMRASY